MRSDFLEEIASRYEKNYKNNPDRHKSPLGLTFSMRLIIVGSLGEGAVDEGD